MESKTKIENILEVFSTLQPNEVNSLILNLIERTQKDRAVVLEQADKVKSETEKAMADLDKAIGKMKFSTYPVKADGYLER